MGVPVEFSNTSRAAAGCKKIQGVMMMEAVMRHPVFNKGGFRTMISMDTKYPVSLGELLAHREETPEEAYRWGIHKLRLDTFAGMAAALALMICL